jgi:hypothetical protein
VLAVRIWAWDGVAMLDFTFEYGQRACAGRYGLLGL